MAMLEIPNSCTPVCAPAAPCAASLRAVCVRPYAAHPSACGLRAWLRVVCSGDPLTATYSLEGNGLDNLTTGVALPGAFTDYQIIDLGQCACGSTPGPSNTLGQTTMASSTSVAIASDQSPIPIKARTAIAWTNVSGAITVGGTSQVLMAANAAREGFEFMNVSSGDLWIMDAAAATLASPSFLVKAGGWYYMATNGVSPSAFQVIGATTGQGYSARQW